MERVVYQQMAELDDRHWWYRARRRIIADLIRRRVWLAGIGMVIVAAVAQAAALATGPIALVQPIFII